MLSSTLEGYLIVIYTLSQEDEEVRCSEIAKTLKVPLKKVVQSIQRMHYQKYLIYSPYQPLKLTPKGEQTAKHLISRNALIDEFLGILEITENIETEREAMQQYLSKETLEVIEKFVLFYRTYPEVSNRYRNFLKRRQKIRLLEPLEEKED